MSQPLVPVQTVPQQPATPDGWTVQRVIRLLLIGASIEATARAIAGVLGLPYRAVRLAMQLGHLAEAKTPAGLPGNQNGPHSPVQTGTPNAWLRNSNIAYRAAYIVSASHRIAQSVADGDVAKALPQEKRFFDQHLAANKARALAVEQVNTAWKQHGDLLGWYAREDKRTSPACHAAHGHNFHAGYPPMIGYPGAVHDSCRCTSGAPFPEEGMVDDVVSEDER
jgi:hypothetical protein